MEAIYKFYFMIPLQGRNLRSFGDFLLLLLPLLFATVVTAEKTEDEGVVALRVETKALPANGTQEGLAAFAKIVTEAEDTVIGTVVGVGLVHITFVVVVVKAEGWVARVVTGRLVTDRSDDKLIPDVILWLPLAKESFALPGDPHEI